MPTVACPTLLHPRAGGPAGSKPKPYNPRHPERTLLYQTVAEHFEPWLDLASAVDADTVAQVQTARHNRAGGGPYTPLERGSFVAACRLRGS